MMQEEHQLAQVQALADKRYVQLKAIESMSRGTLGVLKEDSIYEVLAQTVVQHLKWDGAVIIEMQQDVCARATFHLTQKQLRTLETDLPRMPEFLKSYAHHEVVSTIGKNDATSLALRTALQTDEVVGAPITFGDQLFGFLLACSHTTKNQKRTQDDVLFLKTLTSLAAHAVENCRSVLDLETQNNKLRQLDELKDSFISITSHQLRTPLSIVKWILSLLEADADLRKYDEQHKLIEQAYVANERLIHVVNDLLNVSRIQEGKLPYAPQLSDIHSVLQELMGGTETLAKSKSVIVEKHLDAQVPLVQLDPILFKESVQNLIDNAIDYNQEGGTVKIALEHKDNQVFVHVTNTGPGLSEGERHAIFEQFYRSKDAMRMHPNGTGLGLYLTRAIIRQHGGDVSCQSDPGKETTFSISLPVPSVVQQ
jgi:signal transduction histidine kinase